MMLFVQLVMAAQIMHATPTTPLFLPDGIEVTDPTVVVEAVPDSPDLVPPVCAGDCLGAGVGSATGALLGSGRSGGATP